MEIVHVWDAVLLNHGLKRFTLPARRCVINNLVSTSRPALVDYGLHPNNRQSPFSSAAINKYQRLFAFFASVGKNNSKGEVIEQALLEQLLCHISRRSSTRKAN